MLFIYVLITDLVIEFIVTQITVSVNMFLHLKMKLKIM